MSFQSLKHEVGSFPSVTVFNINWEQVQIFVQTCWWWEPQGLTHSTLVYKCLTCTHHQKHIFEKKIYPIAENIFVSARIILRDVYVMEGWGVKKFPVLTNIWKLPRNKLQKVLNNIIVLKRWTNICRVSNCDKMTIVTKLPSEAEKKKEAEANEVPLVQVDFSHFPSSSSSPTSSTTSSSSSSSWQAWWWWL